MRILFHWMFHHWITTLGGALMALGALLPLRYDLLFLRDALLIAGALIIGIGAADARHS